MRQRDTSGVWAYKTQTLEVLGISNAALILLQRDDVLPADCPTCGRIRWKVDELHARRDEVRQYLVDTYGTLSGNLLTYSNSDTIEVSK